jgi:methionyl-tRNA formyltransferase
VTDRPLRVAYLGNDAWSVPPLEAVASSDHEVVHVVTRTARPGRRGAGDDPTPVAAAARRLSLPLDEVETVREGGGFAALVGAVPDVLAVVAYGEILPRPVLDVAAVAPVNVHFSLLPKLRGASPVQTALLLGLNETGVTTIIMDEGLDTGDVLERARAQIEPDDDAGSLGDRLARLGGAVLLDTLDALASGSARSTPQDDGAATYARKLRPEDRRIDWSGPAPDVVNRVRAFAPDPGATTTFRGSPLKVLRVRAADGSGPPGTIVEVDRDGFAVAAGTRAVRMLDVAPAGRQWMTGSAFVNGHRPAVGERLS